MKTKNFKLEKGEIVIEQSSIANITGASIDLKRMDAKVTNLADRELKRRAKLFDGKMKI